MSKALATKNVAAVLLALTMAFGFIFAFAHPSQIEAKSIPVDVIISGIVEVNSSDNRYIDKYYDYDAHVICYVSYRGMSCVHE